MIKYKPFPVSGWTPHPSYKTPDPVHDEPVWFTVTVEIMSVRAHSKAEAEEIISALNRKPDLEIANYFISED